MMDFVIRISPEGDMEFRRSEGEKKVDCGDGIKAYLYGVVDAPEALCQMAAEDDGAFPAKRHEIIGAYTLVTVDEAKKRLRLYRSSMGGNKPVYYAAMEDGFYIFSSIKCLKQLGYPSFEESTSFLLMSISRWIQATWRSGTSRVFWRMRPLSVWMRCMKQKSA